MARLYVFAEGQTEQTFADKFLKQEKGADVFFTTMIDLYALYADFPKLAGAKKLRHDPYKRIAFLESAFGDDIGDARFISHLQLHEFEAYLFTDIKGLGLFYEDTRKLANLQSISDEYTSPELIDDGPETAPSKRIISQFPDYAAQICGRAASCRADRLNMIRDKCPHFNDWLSRLEKLGGKDGH